MAKRSFDAESRLPDGHHQNWDLVTSIVAEVERMTDQWPTAETELQAIGGRGLNKKYNSIIDAQIDLGGHARDVTEIGIYRWDHTEPDSSGYAIQTLLADGKKTESSVYVSGPVKSVCEQISRGIQAFILDRLRGPDDAKSTSANKDSLEIRLSHLHPRVKADAISRIRSGHGDHAVEEACKSVGARLRNMSGSDKDGVDLVSITLGPNGPIRISSGTSSSDISLQEGYMHLARALYRAARNPRAHRPSNPNVDIDEVIEWLSVASALHRALDQAAIRN